MCAAMRQLISYAKRKFTKESGRKKNGPFNLKRGVVNGHEKLNFDLLYMELRENNILYHFNKKKEHDDIIPTIALVKDDWHKREDGAAKTSVVLLKQRSNTYLPVCQEGLLNGGRRVEAAGPA